MSATINRKRARESGEIEGCQPQIAPESVYPIHHTEQPVSKRARTRPTVLESRRQEARISGLNREDFESEDEEYTETFEQASFQSKLYVEMNAILRDLHSESHLHQPSHQFRKLSSQQALDDVKNYSEGTRRGVTQYDYVHSNRLIADAFLTRRRQLIDKTDELRSENTTAGHSAR